MSKQKSVFYMFLVCMVLGHNVMAGPAENVALGKQVSSLASESKGYARAASCLTDGNPKTDAYPGAFSLDYAVDLTVHAEGGTKTRASGYNLQSLVIDWGKFGRHFPGHRREDGSWSPAAYKADYVNWYRIDYACGAADDWQKLHECAGRPTDEDAANVKVERDPVTASYSEGEVTTTLQQLDLHHVARIRIRARGGHWIGVHELKAFGTPCLPGDEPADHAAVGGSNGQKPDGPQPREE